MNLPKRTAEQLIATPSDNQVAALLERVPVRFLPAQQASETLIISFHGAVDRETREVPTFVPFLPGLETSAHQLSVSDPLLLEHADLTNAWYAGSEDFPLQSHLISVIDAFAEALKVSKLIFFGTSGGGFAALVNAWHSKFKNNVAIIGNPQTNLEKYYKKRVTAYHQTCWPSVKEQSGVFDEIIGDAGTLYGKRFSRTVIYLQSTADEFHLTNHMIPFLSKTAEHKAARLILDCSYWGRTGHNIDAKTCLPWIKAALSAPTTSKADILGAKNVVDSLAHPNAPAQPAQSSKNSKFDPQDISVSDAIRDWTLKI